MKKLFTMIMVIIVVMSCIGNADAAAWNSKETDLVKIYTDKFINELIVEAEQEREDGDVDYYEVELDADTMVLHVYASVLKDDDRFYDCYEAFYQLNEDRIVEAKGDIDEYEFEDTDCLYFAEITCVAELARH